MKLKSIYIDGLHNASAKTYQINDLVYFYGRNGTGKTTVLNAIQLALLGYIPGTAKNSREALLRHSKSGRILVRLELDNNGSTVIIERKYEAKSAKTTIIPEDFDIQSVISEIELPIFNFNDFVGQTSNKLKEYFIKNILPTSDGELDWENILKEGLFDVNVEDRDETVKYGMDLLSSLEGSSIEQVTRANAIFKEEQSFSKSELTRLQATIDSLIYYSDYNGPRDLSEIDSNLLSLGAIRDAIIRYESAYKVIAYSNEERSKLKAQFESMGGEAQQIKVNADLKEAESLYDTLMHQAKDIELAINDVRNKRSNLAMIIQKGNICPYTNETCTGINIEEVRQKIETLNVHIEVGTQKLHDLNAEMDILKGNINKYASMASEFSAIMSKIDALNRSMATLPDKPDTNKTLQDIDEEIQKYTQDRDKLKANLNYEATVENITKLKYKSELNNNALTAWVKLTDTNGLQTKLTEKPFEDLANTMTKYIQDMYGDTSLKAKFNISTKANSFSFGLVRDGNYISYEQLSSGEKCLYTLALMICITDTSKSPLKLMLCDDMFDHLDSQAVENTFIALKKIPNIQFILAGVKECKNAEDVTFKV